VHDTRLVLLGSGMDNQRMTTRPLLEPPKVTLFLKPALGITVQSHTLAVTVRAHSEGTKPAGQPARG
jgi:hypothetical protein